MNDSSDLKDDELFEWDLTSTNISTNRSQMLMDLFDNYLRKLSGKYPIQNISETKNESFPLT